MRLRESVKSLIEKSAISIPAYKPLFARECQSRDLLNRLQIDTVIDVGAFTGLYAAELRKWGFAGQIYSFEPVPASFAKLCDTMQGDPRWKGHNFGLSDSSVKTVINTYSAGDFNSLLTLTEKAGEAYSLDSKKRIPVEIELRRLDEVLPELIADNPHARVFLKMDTQGHDLSVFKGASGVLDRILGMQSELAAVQLYDGAPSMTESLAVYRQNGFIPIGFHPVSQTLKGKPVTPEFDVLFDRFSGLAA